MDDRNRPPVGDRGPWLALEGELAAVGALLAGQDADERALAGTVRPGDAENLAGANVEIDAVQRDRAAVVLAQAADRDALADGAAHACRRLRTWVSARSSATAPMVTKPRKSCWTWGPGLSSARPCCSSARRSAPPMVPMIVPLPPERLAPPMITAAKT